MNIARLPHLAAFVLLCIAVEGAFAHARWDPNGPIAPRTTSDGSYPDNIKVGPCGNLPRSATPAVFEAGSTITVKIERTIYHQGHFRIAFSPANDQGFDDNVLADNIPDINTQRYYDQDITLPNTPCDQCTLQLIQTMPDSGPNSNYYSCADIRLTSTQTTAPSTPTQFTAMQQGNAVSLNWNHSASSVVVLESESPTAPTLSYGQVYANGDNINLAKVVYVGSGTETTLAARTSGKRYFYWVYAADDHWQYSSPAATEMTLADLSGGNKGGVIGLFTLIVMLLSLLYARRKLHA